AAEWVAPHPGTDGALAFEMGHVIMKEFLVDRQTERFVDNLRRFSDAPYLVALEQRGEQLVPGKFVTASDLGGEAAEAPRADFKAVRLDRQGTPVVPNGSLGLRFTPADEGMWNVDLGETGLLLSFVDVPGWAGPSAAIVRPRFDLAP